MLNKGHIKVTKLGNGYYDYDKKSVYNFLNIDLPNDRTNVLYVSLCDHIIIMHYFYDDNIKIMHIYFASISYLRGIVIMVFMLFQFLKSLVLEKI
jgi:hypothetical protein